MTATSVTGVGSRGFTLIELLVALAVVAIVLAIGIPSYQDFSSNNRMQVALNRMVGTIHFAKAQAVSRAEPVVICKGSAAGCTTDSDWTQGWAVFVDSDADGTLDSDELLRVQAPLAPGITSFGATTDAADRLTFSAGGHITATGPQTFVMCDRRGFGPTAKALIVTRFGTCMTQKAMQTAESACL
jgi:type IV fimbrial biogenesis protein FimT